MRSGKDTMAELFYKNYGITYVASSEAANKIFIFNKLKGKYNYKNEQECFDDRMNHREEWYLAIRKYNHKNRARLATDILTISDCYVGMRDKEEFDECVKQKLFDLIILIDSSNRVPSEPNTSFNINKSDADLIIDNNGTYDEFESKVLKIGKIIFNKKSP